MIPADRAAAVSRALGEAFGVARFDDIQDLTERAGSNRAFRIVVHGVAYLLRINTRPGDIARQFACMKAAAAAGLAPCVHYANAEDRTCITDFVSKLPFPLEDALRLVPATLRKVHELPPFPVASFNTTCTFLLKKGPAVDGFLDSFRNANILPDGEVNELLTCCTRIAEAYSLLAPDPVPSHNDLFKPDNILFDRGRVWLVDWEAAFQNDRYADLAAVSNMLVLSEADEQLFLSEYFGAPPSTWQSAQLYLMRQLAHVFYALAFLSLGAAKAPADWSVPVPPYADFQRRFWAGEVKVDDNASKTLYGRVHYERFKENLHDPKFEQALQILASV